MSQGIVYFFCGLPAAERLVVSLWTLRKHYNGAAVIGLTTEEEEKIISPAAKQLDAQLMRVPKLGNKHAHYLSKSYIPTWTPFDDTLFLDADTIIVAPLDELFGHRLAITQFADWISTGPRMSGRCLKWKGISLYLDALIARQVKPKPNRDEEYPAINTGVFAFAKRNEQLSLWHAVTAAGAGLFMTDELAMQLIFPDLDCVVLDDSWNVSPLYGIHREEARIWHFHGKKHLRKDACRAIWLPVFEEVMREKVGRINRWAGKYDKYVRAYLAEAKR